MSKSRFRILIIVHFGLAVAGAVANAVWPVSIAGAAVEDPIFGGASPALDLVVGGLLIGVIIVGFAAMLGLFFFQRWSRPAALWATAFLLFCGVPIGPVFESGLASALAAAASMAWGAVLGLAYFGPVACHFGAGASDPPAHLSVS